jgi:hypothetical protein
VYSQKNHLGPGAGRFQLPGCFQAIQDRHRDVDHQHVGLKPGCFVNQSLPIADGLDHIKLRFEEACGGFQEILVVIGQQYAKAIQVFFLEWFGKGKRPETAALRGLLGWFSGIRRFAKA